MIAHHTRAIAASFPSGVPISRPRIVSVTGVNGWYFANCARPGAIVVGTLPQSHPAVVLRVVGSLTKPSLPIRAPGNLSGKRHS
jgi:hypothetical protein